MARKWWKKRSAHEEPRSAFDKEIGLYSSSDEEANKSESSVSVAPSGWWCFGRRQSHAQHADMKKFGFGKKSDKSEGDDDNRAGLFGRKKPAAKEENPYAQQPAEDPYARMTPYQQARANIASGPQAPRPGGAGLPSGPRPGGVGLPSGPGPAQGNGYGTPPPSYQGSPQVGGGYAPDKFGVAGGYGGNRYDSAAKSTSSLPSQRYPTRGPGGYGGLGPAGDDQDANRDELLRGAWQQPAAPPSYMSTDQNVTGAGSATNDSYGGYGEQRQLTAEELEQEEYRTIKNEIRDVRKQTVSSAANAARQMENSLGVGRGVLVNLGRQGESLANTEKNLDLAMNQTRAAREKTEELVTLNRSMFAMHVKNPFTSKSRQAVAEQKINEQYEREAAEREATRKSAWEGMQNMETTFRDLNRPQLLGTTRSTAERSKYAIEEDSDEEGAAEANHDEDQIDEYMAVMQSGAAELNYVAKAIGAEVDRQTTVIERVGDKSERADKGLYSTRRRLDGIH